eukprot:5150506-Pleurochrysis_carterae.AAC.1
MQAFVPPDKRLCARGRMKTRARPRLKSARRAEDVKCQRGGWRCERRVSRMRESTTHAQPRVTRRMGAPRVRSRACAFARACVRAHQRVRVLVGRGRVRERARLHPEHVLVVDGCGKHAYEDLAVLELRRHRTRCLNAQHVRRRAVRLVAHGGGAQRRQRRHARARRLDAAQRASKGRLAEQVVSGVEAVRACDGSRARFQRARPCA